MLDVVLGFRLAPDRVGAASTRRSGLRSHATQLRAGAISAMGTRFGGESFNPLVDTLSRQSPRGSLYSRCADSRISLTQNLQYADFFVVTCYAAKRKKKWKKFWVVRRLRSGRASLPVGSKATFALRRFANKNRESTRTGILLVANQLPIPRSALHLLSMRGCMQLAVTCFGVTGNNVRISLYVCGLKPDDRRVATLDLRYGRHVT